MSYIIPTSFSAYFHTDEEQIQGSILTIAQAEFIQNQLALAAEEKLNLELDPYKPLIFTQEEARLKGMIQAFTYLLDCSSTSIELQNAANNLPAQ